MVTAVNALTDAGKLMTDAQSSIKVPPPRVCASIKDFPIFFKEFERFVLAEYGPDEEVWMQVFDPYLKGEASKFFSALTEVFCTRIERQEFYKILLLLER